MLYLKINNTDLLNQLKSYGQQASRIEDEAERLIEKTFGNKSGELGSQAEAIRRVWKPIFDKLFNIGNSVESIKNKLEIFYKSQGDTAEANSHHRDARAVKTAKGRIKKLWQEIAPNNDFDNLYKEFDMFLVNSIERFIY